jgi:hypothetical protein
MRAQHASRRQRRHKIGRRGFTAIVAASLLAAAGGAFAILNLIGTGTGTGAIVAGQSAGKGNVELSVHVLSTAPFVPGSTGTNGATVQFDVTNPNQDPVLIKTITFAGVTSPDAACQAVITAEPTQFVQVANSVTENTVVPAASVDFLLPNNAVLNWVDELNLDQTPCLGATLNLAETTP